MPAFRLDANDAFTCMTYVWRHGEKAAQDRRPSDAIGWFLLIQHAAFGSLETKVKTKVLRFVKASSASDRLSLTPSLAGKRSSRC